MISAAPPGYYPIDILVPGFQTLGHWLPSTDAIALDWLASKYSGRRFLEIGTFVGTTATILGKHAGHLTCMDTWAGSSIGDQINQFYEQHDVKSVCRQNLASLIAKRRVALVNPAVWDAHFVDLTFIDADHTYESVKKDIDTAFDVTLVGGIICGHDYGLFPGVTQAADEFGIDGVIGSVWWRIVE